MPFFTISKNKLTSVEQTNFETERELQRLIEENLGEVFNCRFVATEFSTGENHAGRIDTLALSEDGNPVIIEYKKVESSDLVNQSLFYLSWIRDHRGDFEIAVHRRLGASTKVDWSDVRVICIAPNYRKYDLHAVQVMGANIELWQYRRFANGSLYLEEVFQRAYVAPGVSPSEPTKGSPRKTPAPRRNAAHTFEMHTEGKPESVVELAHAFQEFILGLDPAIEEAPKQLYVAYKSSQNIACLEIHKKKLLVFLKIDPKTLRPFPNNARDVSEIGHFGTGDLELRISTVEELEAAKPLIELSYRRVGA